MKRKGRSLRIFTKGIIRENPVLRLMLGCCASLAVTTSAINGLSMGLATTFVLVCSGAIISAMRKIVPDSVRLPSFIVTIAGLVGVLQMFVKAYIPSLDRSLGVFLSLIAVNCIVFGRAEMFASKNRILPSILDGAGMGIGYTLALVLIGAVRELLGAGTVFGINITAGTVPPIIIFLLPPGGFFVYAILVAVAGRLSETKVAPESIGCDACKGCAAAAECTNAEKEAKNDC